ncbi:hypothetical protein [Pseudomonas sp. S2_A02]
MSKKTAWLVFPCVCLLFSLASLYLAKVTGALDSTRHNICFNIDSSANGLTQAFTSRTPEAFNEHQSTSKVLTQGRQKVCFPVTIGERFIRWDPNNNYSSMLINQASVTFLGLNQPLALDQLISKTSGITNSEPKQTELLLHFTDPDPQIIFEIGDSIRYKELLYSAIILTIAYALALYIANLLVKKLIIEKIPAYRMAIFAIIALTLTHQFTGVIAVGDGAGWDGNAYLNLIFDWKQSEHFPDTDPYRMSRLPGFAPLIALEFLHDFSRQQLIQIQVILNIIGFGAASGFFLDYLMRSGLSLKKANEYTLMMLLSWPVMVMSTYYPLLSDHLAIIFSCFSLWCFSKKHRASLLVLCLISPLVMPGLFLLPFTLLAFSSTQESNGWLSRWATSPQFKIVLFLLFSIIMTSFTYSSLNQISDTELLNIGLSIAPGLPNLKKLSFMYVLCALIVVSWLWSNHFPQKEFFSNLSINWLLLALFASIFGHAALYFGLNWNTGFKGPNLWQNMIFQSLNAPLKPLISHFVYFGPLFIVALALLFRSTDSKRLHYPVKIAILGFLPILAIGSETRQWVAILPFLVAFIAQYGIKSRIRKLILGFSVLLAAPLFWLPGSVERAFALKLPMTEPLWQLYFGRHGPWMSYTTYLISGALMLVFIAFWMLAKRKDHSVKMADE